MTEQGFYRAFEEKHRGPRELILQRLQAYRPFFEPMQARRSDARAIDLGCGRGEWLQLLLGSGFEVMGVDINEDMLAACREHGLPAICGDALTFLQSQPDASTDIISAFHVVEHIPFEALDTLVRQALRVLRAGGLLIMETPNPENLVVGTNTFYLDPTHIRPVAPLLLEFLPQYHGYVRSRIVRLQESSELVAAQEVSLMQVFGGVSPDYAVVAQKQAGPDFLQIFDAAFAMPFGIGLHELSQRYDDAAIRRTQALQAQLDALSDEGGLAPRHKELDRSLQHQFGDVTAMLRQMHELLTVRLEQIEEERARLHSQLQSSEQRIAELGGSSHHWAMQAQSLERQLQAYRASLSWKITAPLRLCLRVLRSPAGVAMGWALREPARAARLNRIVRRFPPLHRHLRQRAVQQGLMSPVEEQPATQPAAGVTLADLSPRALHIHAELSEILGAKRGG